MEQSVIGVPETDTVLSEVTPSSPEKFPEKARNLYCHWREKLFIPVGGPGWHITAFTTYFVFTTRVQVKQYNARGVAHWMTQISLQTLGEPGTQQLKQSQQLCT